LEKLQALRTKLNTTISRLSNLTSEINHQNLHETVTDLHDRLSDPFMFVIVGEVKAGKSSFINALLDTGEDICKVAASPMTDTIQQIVYGKVRREEYINDYLKRIYIPEEKLKEIAIVDTPGTNTIVDHHQEITERFIPASDLIIFVFESKNPYRQSAWDFFDFIKDEWRKKIIFILQQKDLMTPDDLVTNFNGVKEYAQKKGIPDPNVFSVSAKMEKEGNKENSGYQPVRAYIEKNITGGRAPFLKLGNITDTSYNINEKIYDGLLIRRKQYEADVKFREEISVTLSSQETKTERQIDILVENLLATYDRITRTKEEELKKGISFTSMLKRSFNSMFGFEKSPKEYLDNLAKDFELQLNTSLRDRLNDGVIEIADSIQEMGKQVDRRIKDSETILRNNHEIFADIAEKRANVLKDLQLAFSDFLKKSENFYDEEVIGKDNNITPSLAAGGGIAVVGVIIATVTNAAVFDVTGGILTTVGLLFAGVTVGIKRKKILNTFKEEILKGRNSLQYEVAEKLKNYSSKIKIRIDENFDQFDQHLNNENDTINHLDQMYQSIKIDLKDSKAEIDHVLELDQNS